MTWSKVDKDKSRWERKRSARGKVYRGAFGKYNTRGEIAEEIHGDAGATVTRKDIKDRFGIKVENNFTEKDKGSSNWNEVEKE